MCCARVSKEIECLARLIDKEMANLKPAKVANLKKKHPGLKYTLLINGYLRLENYGFYSVAVVHKNSSLQDLAGDSLKNSLACIADMSSVGTLLLNKTG